MLKVGSQLVYPGAVANVTASDVVSVAAFAPNGTGIPLTAVLATEVAASQLTNEPPRALLTQLINAIVNYGIGVKQFQVWVNTAQVTYTERGHINTLVPANEAATSALNGTYTATTGVLTSRTRAC